MRGKSRLRRAADPRGISDELPKTQPHFMRGSTFCAAHDGQSAGSYMGAGGSSDTNSDTTKHKKHRHKKLTTDSAAEPASPTSPPAAAVSTPEANSSATAPAPRRPPLPTKPRQHPEIPTRRSRPRRPVARSGQPGQRYLSQEGTLVRQDQEREIHDRAEAKRPDTSNRREIEGKA